VKDGGYRGIVLLGKDADEGADLFERKSAIHLIIRAGENVQILAC
jgi:hypothetical protein